MLKTTLEYTLSKKSMMKDTEFCLAMVLLVRKLENNNQIEATYITSSGEEGNGVSNFIFSGVVFPNSDESNPIATGISLISTNTPSNGGAEIESISSIKYLSTRLYLLSIEQSRQEIMNL